MTAETTPSARVLRYVDRGSDLVLYEAGAAAAVLEQNETVDDAELVAAFDPAQLGVPRELHHFYVIQFGNMTRWRAPMSSDLPEIRREAEGIGWRLEEGSMDDLPQRWGDS